MSYILNFLISNSSIKNVQELPNIKNLIIKIHNKKKTIYLIMTTFFIFLFLANTLPKLSNKNFLKKLELILNKKNSFKFLSNFY